MNLELIRKYEKEFLHMLHGGTLMFKPNDKQVWFDSVTSPIDWTVEGLYVIDDIYCTYRMALAEGKTVQFFNTKERLYDSSKPLHTWQDIDKIHTQGRQSDYRIKPEKPKFKVGDWVENITCTSTRIIKQVVNAPEGYDTVTVGNIDVGINVVLINDLELWQPKPGEWCWFWEIGSTPTLGQYSKYINGEYEAITIYPKYKLQGLFSFCEPFIGKLPTYIKR